MDSLLAAESAHIRAVYTRCALSGVPNDGSSRGEELTRGGSCRSPPEGWTGEVVPVPEVDRYGFFIAEPSGSPVEIRWPGKRWAKKVRSEEERVRKWGRVMRSGQVQSNLKSGQLKNNLNSGQLQNTQQNNLHSAQLHNTPHNNLTSGQLENINSGQLQDYSNSGQLQNNAHSGQLEDNSNSGQLQNTLHSGQLQNDSNHSKLQNNINSGQLQNNSHSGQQNTLHSSQQNTLHSSQQNTLHSTQPHPHPDIAWTITCDFRTLLRYTSRGVPDRWRSAVWVAALDFDLSTVRKSKKLSKRNRLDDRPSSWKSFSTPLSAKTITSIRTDPSTPEKSSSSSPTETEDGFVIISAPDATPPSTSTSTTSASASAFCHTSFDINTPSPYDVQIDLDVPRTMPTHSLFHTRYGAGQRSLFSVLHSLSLQRPDVGYCQGMASVVAVLLCYLPDSQALTVMSTLISDRFGDMFHPGFSALLQCIYIQERVVAALMPSLFELLSRNQISSTSYVTKWYITLFHGVLPFATQLRVFDLFFLLGTDILVLTSVAILWSLRIKLTSTGADLETMLSTLTSSFVMEDDNLMFDWIITTYKRVDVQKLITSAKADWKGFCEAGTTSGKLL